VSCSSTPGTGALTVSGFLNSYMRLYAGELLEAGPVAPSSAGPPLILYLVFSNEASMSQSLLQCCGADAACCTIDGFAGTSDAITNGAELGTHGFTLKATAGSAMPDLVLTGTVDITDFRDPFTITNGSARVAGSATVSSGAIIGNATFANGFCDAFLSETI
jgi:hypothetical protein